MINLFGYIGRAALARAREVSSVWSLIIYALSAAFTGMKRGRRVVVDVFFRQVYFTGYEAVPIISWIALILGFVVVAQALSILPGLGGESLVGKILVWVVIREAGPVFAAVIVIARSGTAIAAELGSMKIGRELTALELMGIDPVRYLVAPRIIGTAVSVMVLTFCFEAVSIVGGFVLAGFGGSVTFHAYFASLLEAMGLLDIAVSLLKSAVFGLIIGAVCSYQGLLVRKSITQIPQVTTRAVMRSLTSVFFLDAVITSIFYM
ncbi:MAG: ABC transporter permease [Deltaproteobacteria bacterium]|nr:ABC transporter permease [Deltaproteobacteria bacterium]